MATIQPTVVAPSSGEEIQLAADGRTESIAIRLRASPTRSRSTARDRRHERRWIKDAQRGSGEALEALYGATGRGRTGPPISIVHDAAAAEDIAQEAFLAAVRALDRFDRRRPFGPWLHRIVVNRAIDWARARALRGEAAAERAEAATVARRRASRSEPALSESVVAALAAALAGAPGGDRSPLPARVHAGRDRRELELPRGTVNSRLRRALDRLGRLLEEER